MKLWFGWMVGWCPIEKTQKITWQAVSEILNGIPGWEWEHHFTNDFQCLRNGVETTTIRRNNDYCNEVLVTRSLSTRTGLFGSSISGLPFRVEIVMKLLQGGLHFKTPPPPNRCLVKTDHFLLVTLGASEKTHPWSIFSRLDEQHFRELGGEVPVIHCDEKVPPPIRITLVNSDTVHFRNRVFKVLLEKTDRGRDITLLHLKNELVSAHLDAYLPNPWLSKKIIYLW